MRGATYDSSLLQIKHGLETQCNSLVSLAKTVNIPSWCSESWLSLSLPLHLSLRLQQGGLATHLFWESAFEQVSSPQRKTSRLNVARMENIFQMEPFFILLYFSLIATTTNSVLKTHKGFSVTTGTWGPSTKNKHGCYLSHAKLEIPQIPLNQGNSLMFCY